MLKLNSNYICTLDIGSSKIAACAARIRKGHIQDIFFDSEPSKGIVRQGGIVNSVKLVGSITRFLKRLKVKSGINFKYIHTNISGMDIVTKRSSATIPLAERGNKVITSLDIQRIDEQARLLGSSLGEEIIHQIPFSYTVDSKNDILNPIGLYSHKLQVDLYLICARLSSVQSLSGAIGQSGYEIKGLSFSGLATSRAVIAGYFKEGVNLFCDIGSDITELLLFRDGVLRDIEILNTGGDYFTEKIQDILKIPFDLAEDIKRSYGFIGDPTQIEEDKEILVKKSNIYMPIKQKAVVEITNSCAKSVCAQLKEAVGKKMATYKADNFIVVGRAILLDGFIEFLEQALSIPVKLGRINHPEMSALIKESNELSGQKYLIYLTCLGMLCEALNEQATGTRSVRHPATFIAKAIDRFKEVYREYF